MLKYFRIWSRICGDIRVCLKNSPVSLTPRSQVMRCHWYSGVKCVSKFAKAFSPHMTFHDSFSIWPKIHGLKPFCVGVQGFEVQFLILKRSTDYAMSMTLLSQAPRCHWHRADFLWVRANFVMIFSIFKGMVCQLRVYDWLLERQKSSFKM